MGIWGVDCWEGGNGESLNVISCEYLLEIYIRNRILNKKDNNCCIHAIQINELTTFGK